MTLLLLADRRASIELQQPGVLPVPERVPQVPLAIDLFCGLGGWTEGFLAEGYSVIGFDLERHIYGAHQYPAQLVLQDVTTLDGAQFRDARVIVASPPCQGYSYRAMPWKRAKALPPPDNTLFEACFRIQREASEAAGCYIPLVVENVRGAQKWVGRAQWHYGSYYLWGDVPALMPSPVKAHKLPGFRFDGSGGSFQSEAVKVAGLNWSDHAKPGYRGQAFNSHAERATKNDGGSWFAVAHNTRSAHSNNARDGRKTVGHANLRDGFSHTRHLTNQAESDAVKQHGSGPVWFDQGIAASGSKSNARKAASARIAKIPFALARHIAQVYAGTFSDQAGSQRRER